MNALKICEYCEFYKRSKTDHRGFGVCKKTTIKKVSLVTGEVIYNEGKYTPIEQRRHGLIESLIKRTCGKHGRWWKPKPQEVSRVTFNSQDIGAVEHPVEIKYEI